MIFSGPPCSKVSDDVEFGAGECAQSPKKLPGRWPGIKSYEPSYWIESGSTRGPFEQGDD